MYQLREQMAARGWAPMFLMFFTFVVGGLSFVFNFSDAIGGEGPAMGRMILGLVGVVGALMAFSGISFERVTGWHVMMFWAVAQIPFVAWSLAGSPTEQVVTLPISMLSTVDVIDGATNAVYGINLVGVVLAAAFMYFRTQLESVTGPEPFSA